MQNSGHSCMSGIWLLFRFPTYSILTVQSRVVDNGSIGQTGSAQLWLGHAPPTPLISAVLIAVDQKAIKTASKHLHSQVELIQLGCELLACSLKAEAGEVGEAKVQCKEHTTASLGRCPL